MSKRTPKRAGTKTHLTSDANHARQAMVDQYGYERGNQVFYARAERLFDGPRTVHMSEKANTVYAKHGRQTDPLK